MNYNKVKDSGKRQDFTSGAVRDTNVGKGRFDLISPIALLRLAKHYENGAIKYGDNNYLKGMPIKRFIESALRHINCYLLGDRSEDHLSASSWNLMAAIHMESCIFNETMPVDLILDQCYINEKDKDELSKMWWNELKKLQQKANKSKK